MYVVSAGTAAAEFSVVGEKKGGDSAREAGGHLAQVHPTRRRETGESLKTASEKKNQPDKLEEKHNRRVADSV